MGLAETIKNDLTVSIKEKKEREILVLRQLLAAILNKAKEKRHKLSQEKPDLKEEDLEKESQLTEEEIMKVIVSEVKKRKESILEFEKGKREELAEKEKKELEVLKKYLPEPLSVQDIEKEAKAVIENIGAKEMKDMGKVMKELSEKLKGRADGSEMSKIVKELLQN